MLLLDRTRATESFEYSVLPSAMITAEGQPVVADYSTGLFNVKPAEATATDKFVGVTISQQINLVALPFIEEIVADTTNSLSRTNLFVGQLRAVGSVTGALTVVNAPAVPVAGEVSVNWVNGTLTFNAAQAGETVTVSYRYVPTSLEALTVQGNITPGGSSTFVLNSTGVITRGDIYTTEYNPVIDWATAATSGWIVAVKNGLFTAYATAAAAAADGAVVVVDGIITNVPAAGLSVIGTGSNAVLGVKY